jgi:hypothetical protein
MYIKSNVEASQGQVVDNNDDDIDEKADVDNGEASWQNRGRLAA